MLRTLLTPRWLARLAVAVLFAVVAAWLGSWQYGRHEERVAHRDRVEAHYDADPVPLARVMGTAGSVETALEWTRVSATGRYDGNGRLFVRNRPYQGTYGYQVVVPFDTGAGTVLVDRGWVPNTERAAVLPDVAPEPTEQVELTGWLRPGEPGLGRDLPAGQLASIDIAAAEQQLGTDLLDGYVVLEAEQLADGSTPQRPQPTEPPTTELGPHFAYALQWWLTAPLGFVLVGVFVRREHRDRWARQNPEEAAAVPVPARRTRIWDEEDG